MTLRFCTVAWVLVAGFGTAAAGAALGAASDLTPLQPEVDYHSFANVEQFRVTRLELDLRVDPFFKTLRGVVGLQVKRLDPNATELILDTRDLNISDVTVKAQDVLGATSKSETTWVSRPFHFEKKDPILGQAPRRAGEHDIVSAEAEIDVAGELDLLEHHQGADTQADGDRELQHHQHGAQRA